MTDWKSRAPDSDPSAPPALRPFLFRPLIAPTTSSATPAPPCSLTTPPIHSSRLRAKDNISCPVRLTRHRGYRHSGPGAGVGRRVLVGWVSLKAQCWSSRTRSSRSRGEGSQGSKRECWDSRVDVTRSILSDTLRMIYTYEGSFSIPPFGVDNHTSSAFHQ